MAKQIKRTKDGTALDISYLEAEKRALYQQNNPKRLREIENKLLYLYYGIKN